MRRSKISLVIGITILLALTLVALAFTAVGIPSRLASAQPADASEAPQVSLSSHLVQDKILKNGDGQVDLVVTLTGRAAPRPTASDAPPVDLVVVLDRSGSMAGPKIADAKRAVQGLITQLGARDRFGLVTYADGVRTDYGLNHVDDRGREKLARGIDQIRTGGSTNLSAGMLAGLASLREARREAAQKRLILISDGRANRGITRISDLRRVAAEATEQTISISTVGVGYDFNEQLMTAIADNGAGVYYYLEDPQAFAGVFREELQRGRRTVATAMEVRLPLEAGMRLVEAAGFPVTHDHGQARFYPGNLHAGQERRLFLKVRVPSHRLGQYTLGPVSVRYHDAGRAYTARVRTPLTLACIEDPREVYRAIDKVEWEEKVLERDYGRLKSAVAADIAKGDRQAAIKKIDGYRTRNQEVNAHVGSQRVDRDLDSQTKSLQDMVQQTFEGSPAAVAGKQKANAKVLQYEGYQVQRQH